VTSYSNAFLPSTDYDDVTQTSSPRFPPVVWRANSGYRLWLAKTCHICFGWNKTV